VARPRTEWIGSIEQTSKEMDRLFSERYEADGQGRRVVCGIVCVSLGGRPRTVTHLFGRHLPTGERTEAVNVMQFQGPHVAYKPRAASKRLATRIVPGQNVYLMLARFTRHRPFADS